MKTDPLIAAHDSAVLVSGHTIYLHLPFHIDDQRLFSEPSTRLSALREASWRPGLDDKQRAEAEDLKRHFDAKSARRTEGPAEPHDEKQNRIDLTIWHEAEWSIAPDMELQVARLLSKLPPNANDEEHGMTVSVWALKADNNTRNALQGRTGLARYHVPHLTVAFPAAARRRMETRLGAQAPETMAVDFGEIRAVAFRTGLGLLIVQIQIGPGGQSVPLPMPVLVEALVALCSDRHLRWMSHNGEELKPSRPTPEFGLRDIFRTLLGDYGTPTVSTPRLYTYTYAKLDAKVTPAERQRFMLQLACKYTDDYRIDVSHFREKIYQPFESISHLAVLEGAVTLVEDVRVDDRRSSFLMDFGANAIERRYLPVVVLAYHAFLTLLTLTQDSRRWISLRAPSREEARTLRKLRDRILEFRLFYRLSYVSLLTMPNELYHRLWAAFGLDKLLNAADRDVAEISTLLDARIKAAHEQRVTWFRRLTATSLSVISGATLAKVIFEVLSAAPIKSRLPSTTIPLDVAGPVVELILAVVLGAVAWWWSEGGSIETHLQEDAIVHEGLEREKKPERDRHELPKTTDSSSPR